MKKGRISKMLLTFLLFVLVSVVCPSYNNSVFAAPAISSKSATLIKGQKKQLKVKGTKKQVKWSSSKKSVATVTSKGVVTAKAKGTATITAKVGNKKYTCKVTVQDPKINKTKVSIYVGKTYSLKLTGTNKKITWKSSNKSVATVSSKGKVTAKKAGTATITATVLGKKFNCKVTVKKKASTAKNNVTWTSHATDYGAVVIAQNNYSYPVEITVDAIYYKNGVMMSKSSDYTYALEPGRQCALRCWEYNHNWNSYKINMKVEREKYITTYNASKIKVTSNWGTDRNVMAHVVNNGKKNSYTKLAIVYYKNGKVVGYDDRYADVDYPGTSDYIEFSGPYDRNYDDIYADSYKIFVNFSYAYQ